MGTESKRASVATLIIGSAVVVLLILVAAIAFVLIRQSAVQQGANFGFSTPAAAAWTPPKKPNPSTVNTIRDEAQDDTRAGRYADALAKHVWYHENALKHGTGQGGVRLSFALSEWMDLAEQYPPALAKLQAVRDEAGNKAVTERRKPATQYFHDFVAINEKLEEPEKVRALFLKLHKADPDRAQDVYRLAEPVLIKAKEYTLCGEYLDPDAQVPMIIHSYQMNRRLESRFGAHFKRFTERKMTNSSATLVGLLAVKGRQEEAEAAADKLKQEWDDERYHQAIDEALSGKVPEPWP